MISIPMTVAAIADSIANNHTEAAARFINERATKLYSASISRGTYGRIMLPLLKQVYPSMNWNGVSTRVALAVQDRLEAAGYEYVKVGAEMQFVRKQEDAAR